MNKIRCKICLVYFTRYGGNSKYCIDCKTKTCLICNKNIIIKSLKQNKNTCSLKCNSIYRSIYLPKPPSRKGIKPLLESIQKGILTRNINQPKIILRCYVCGTNISRIKSRLYIKNFCSKECRVVGISGKNSHLWRGGISNIRDSIEGMSIYKKWHRNIFDRDNYTCKICGKVSGELQVDHIIPMSYIIRKYKIKSKKDAYNCDKLWDIKNGRTLCIDCHRETDTWGNKYMKTALAWVELFKN